MPMNSDLNALPSQTDVWTIDSADMTTDNLNPVNYEGTHWSLTLTESTPIDDLLDEINNAGWTKVRDTFCWYKCVAYRSSSLSPREFEPVDGIVSESLKRSGDYGEVNGLSRWESWDVP